jgi:hypothetical protein
VDKSVEAVIKHLLGNISAEDTTVALQEIDYNAISAKQMTTKRFTSEGGVTHTSLPLFLDMLARNKKAPEIFKLTTFCNIVMKVEAYTSRNGLTECCNYQGFGYIWVHCRQPPRCLWCGGGQRRRECPEKQNSESVPAC